MYLVPKVLFALFVPRHCLSNAHMRLRFMQIYMHIINLYKPQPHMRIWKTTACPPLVQIVLLGKNTNTNDIKIIRLLANHHPKGPAYYKWSSGGTCLLQFVLGCISACRLEFWINWAAFLKSSICEVPINWLKIEPPYPCQLILMKMSFCIYALRGVKKTVSGVPLNSYILVQYKIFGLKHFIVFVKKGPRPAKITFRPTPWEC